MRELVEKTAAAAGAIALAAGLAAVAIAPAMGQETGRDPIDVKAPVIPTERYVAYVSYSDLDLATKRGEDRLRGRVRSAARDVCPHDYTRMGAELSMECRRIARVGAEPQIALAVTRAQQIAMYGSSDIAPVRIALKLD